MKSSEKTLKNIYRAPAADALLDILEFMSAHAEPCGPAQLANYLNISANLAFRTLQTLEKRTYVHRDTAGGYVLSNRLFSLGMRMQRRFDLRAAVRPHLEKLSAETGETCQFQIPDGDRMLVYDVVTPDSDFYFQVVPGSRTYFHANAFGKCVLAFMDEDEADGIIDGVLEALTPMTITDPQVLRRELETVKRSGIAYDRSEYVAGIYCIGAPVFDNVDKIAGGIGLTGLLSRFDKSQVNLLQQKVKDCARALTDAIR